MMNRTVVVSLLATYAMLTGCRGQPPVPRQPGPPRLWSINELSAAEKLYGHSASAHSNVTYQPDVVMLPARRGRHSIVE